MVFRPYLHIFLEVRRLKFSWVSSHDFSITIQQKLLIVQSDPRDAVRVLQAPTQIPVAKGNENDHDDENDQHDDDDNGYDRKWYLIRLR